MIVDLEVFKHSQENCVKQKKNSFRIQTHACLIDIVDITCDKNDQIGFSFVKRSVYSNLKKHHRQTAFTVLVLPQCALTTF